LPQSTSGRQDLEIEVWPQYHDNALPMVVHVAYKISESQYLQGFQGPHQFGSPDNLLLVLSAPGMPVDRRGG
jgi:hypothetical protein